MTSQEAQDLLQMHENLAEVTRNEETLREFTTSGGRLLEELGALATRWEGGRKKQR